MTLDAFVSRFPDAKRAGAGWMAKCPAHDDKRASLSIAEGAEGRALVTCHAGCDLDTILGTLQLSRRDLFATTSGTTKPTIAAVYPYHDEAGAVLYEVVRFEPKDFRQRRPDGRGGWRWTLGDVRRVLFGLPELINATDVYIAEGERDVLSLRALGADLRQQTRPARTSGATTTPRSSARQARAEWSSSQTTTTLAGSTPRL